MIGNQEFFAIHVTFGFTGHVQVRRNMKIYKIQTMTNTGTVDHVK